MAKKTTTRRSSGGVKINLSCLSFIAVMLVGLALLAAFILGHVSSDLANAARVIERIGLALAILVPSILSYRWARGSKQWVFVLWIVAIVIVIVFYVLAFI